MARAKTSGWLSRHQYVTFIAPAIVVVLAFTAYPALYGVLISFTNMHFAYPDWKFVGFANYVHFFTWGGSRRTPTWGWFASIGKWLFRSDALQFM